MVAYWGTAVNVAGETRAGLLADAFGPGKTQALAGCGLFGPAQRVAVCMWGNV